MLKFQGFLYVLTNQAPENPYPFFKIDFILLSRFRFAAKLSQRYRDFAYNPCSHTRRASPITNIPYEGGTFVVTDGPTLTCYYHPKVRSLHQSSLCCCIFHGFEQMSIVPSPPSQYHIEQCHCPKNPPCPNCLSFSCLTSENH